MAINLPGFLRSLRYLSLGYGSSIIIRRSLGGSGDAIPTLSLPCIVLHLALIRSPTLWWLLQESSSDYQLVIIRKALRRSAKGAKSKTIIPVPC